MKIKPITKADKLLDHFINTTRCNVCKRDYPRKMPECPFCDHVYGEVLEEQIYDSK